MPLDQVANFIQVLVSGTHTSGDSTVSLQSGEASKLPDLTGGKYNLVWFDSQNFRSPDTDPNVEIVRVNSIDTSNDTISVTRGVEDTSASAKNTSGATYELFLGITAKTITDIDSQKLDQNNRYSNSEATSAVESHSFTDLDTAAIVNGSITHLSLDGTGSVSISNGNLTDGTNIIYDQSASEIPDSAMGSIENSTLTNNSVTIEGNSVSLGGSTSINHNDLSTISSNDHHSKTTSASDLTDVSPDSTSNAHHAVFEPNDYNPESDTHSKYTDNDARSAIESGVSRVGGSGLFFDFNNANNYIELVDGNNNRDNLVTEDVYIEQTGEWLGDDHLDVSNAHHSKYTDSNARTAVDGSSLSDLTVSSELTIPEVTSDPNNGNIWIRTDL